MITFIQVIFNTPKNLTILGSCFKLSYIISDRLSAQSTVDESGGGSHMHPGLRAAPAVFSHGASVYISLSSTPTAQAISSKLPQQEFTGNELNW